MIRQFSMIRLASASEEKTCSFRHSSRSRPLKLSTKACLARLARRDVVPLDLGRLAEAQDGVADEFGAPPRGNDPQGRFLILVDR